MVSQTLPVGYLLEQKYQVIQLLGQGAFGATYLVEHIHFKTKHVIKEYLPDSAIRNPSNTIVPKSQGDVETFFWGLKRFFDEAKLLYTLNHPNIVKVTDLFEVHQTAYFVMPYLGNHTFQTWISHHPKPTEEELLSIFIPLLEGLKYIHAQGLLHRDIKPDNILIASNSTPTFIDFGSARHAIGRKSKLVTRVLTPHFAPFEQYSQNIAFSEALDLYSLAASMYQAIVGDYPPLAPDRVTQDDIIKLADVPKYQQRYSQHFLKTIDKNLSFMAKDRDQSALEMQNNLLGYHGLATNEVSAQPVQHNEEWKVWQEASQVNTIDSYQYYMDIYPVGQYIDDAKSFILQLQDQQERDLWAGVLEKNNEQAYQSYLSAYPCGQFVNDAKQFLMKNQSHQKPLVVNSQRISKNIGSQQQNQVKLFSNSRIGRLHYWNLSILAQVICFGASGLIANLAFFFDISELLLLSLAILYIAIPAFLIHLGIRRFHDMNKSGWNVLWTLIPLLALYLIFAKGDVHENKYGAPIPVVTQDKYISIIYLLIMIGMSVGFLTIMQSMSYA